MRKLFRRKISDFGRRKMRKITAALVLSTALLISAGAVSFASFTGADSAGNIQAASESREKKASQKAKADSANKLELEQNNIHITEYKEYTISLSKGSASQLQEISWKSDNEEVAKVNEEGVVTPVSNGTAEVVCVDEKTGKEEVCVVTVSLSDVKAEKLRLSNKKYTLNTIGQKVKLTGTILPKAAADKKLVWKSENKKIAVVDENGVVEAKDWGSTKILCETSNGIKAQCEITVEPEVKVEKVMLNYEELEFSGPQAPSETLEAHVYPENATKQELTFASTDEGVAVVDEKGTVSFVADGECDVVATSTDGTYKSFTCHIIVKDTKLVYTVSEGAVPNVYVPVNPQAANSVIEEASRYVGVIPYVWGGGDLSRGVDCSGFICAVYQRFGYNLWGIRTDLRYAGTEVPDISQAAAGDILVYKGHVALYDGNGGRIHAPDEGYMVTHDYNIGGYYTIRRVIA